LEKLYVLQVVVLKEDISETFTGFDFLLVNNGSADLHKSLLKILGHINPFFNQILVILIKGVVSNPEVGIFALLSGFKVIVFF
jgi:hypothetical protein